MRMLRSYLIITLIATCYSVVGQTGSVRFAVNPGHNYEIKVNQDSIVSVRTMELPVGRHDFQVWAPTYNVMDTGITIMDGVEQTMILHLNRSDEWLEWDAEYRAKRKIRIPLITASSTIGVAGVLFGGWKYHQYRQAHLENLSLVDQYEAEVIPAEILVIKQEIEDNLALTRSRQKGALLGATAGVVGLVGMILVNKKIDIHEIPDWEDKEGLKFHDLSYLYLPEQSGGIHGLNLTLKF